MCQEGFERAKFLQLCQMLLLLQIVQHLFKVVSCHHYGSDKFGLFRNFGFILVILQNQVKYLSNKLYRTKLRLCHITTLVVVPIGFWGLN